MHVPRFVNLSLGLICGRFRNTILDGQQSLQMTTKRLESNI